MDNNMNMINTIHQKNLQSLKYLNDKVRYIFYELLKREPIFLELNTEYKFNFINQSLKYYLKTDLLNLSIDGRVKIYEIIKEETGQKKLINRIRGAFYKTLESRKDFLTFNIDEKTNLINQSLIGSGFFEEQEYIRNEIIYLSLINTITNLKEHQKNLRSLNSLSKRTEYIFMELLERMPNFLELSFGDKFYIINQFLIDYAFYGNSIAIKNKIVDLSLTSKNYKVIDDEHTEALKNKDTRWVVNYAFEELLKNNKNNNNINPVDVYTYLREHGVVNILLHTIRWYFRSDIKKKKQEINIEDIELIEQENQQLIIQEPNEASQYLSQKENIQYWTTSLIDQNIAEASHKGKEKVEDIVDKQNTYDDFSIEMLSILEKEIDQNIAEASHKGKEKVEDIADRQSNKFSQSSLMINSFNQAKALFEERKFQEAFVSFTKIINACNDILNTHKASIPSKFKPYYEIALGYQNGCMEILNHLKKKVDLDIGNKQGGIINSFNQAKALFEERKFQEAFVSFTKIINACNDILNTHKASIPSKFKPYYEIALGYQNGCVVILNNKEDFNYKFISPVSSKRSLLFTSENDDISLPNKKVRLEGSSFNLSK